MSGVVRSSLSSSSGPWESSNSTTLYISTVGYLHQALLPSSSTTPGAYLWYQVGDGVGNWSSVFNATPVSARGLVQETYAVYGDFGWGNNVSMQYLIQDAQAGEFDSVLHVGDFAYNFDTDKSYNGNHFMNAIQAYVAYKPMMPAAGNHENCATCPAVPGLDDSAGNFSEYRARFHGVTLYAGARCGSNNNIYYSFNRGLTHFIVFSAEAYFYPVGATFIANQLAWMRADLASVDRSVTPWVVALVHKSWAMSGAAYKDFAPILEDGGVDVQFVGHVHYYNRYLPYDSVTKQVDNATVSADGGVYTEPKYMVTIVTGASGDGEGENNCTGTAIVSPSYACSKDYGYGYWRVLNVSHAQWSFKGVQADGGGPSSYRDELLIVQNSHGPRKGARKGDKR